MNDILPTPAAQPAVLPPTGRRWRSGIVATGAALGMTLAGLGIAGAQTAGTNESSTVMEAPGPAQEGAFAIAGNGPRAGGPLRTAAQALGMTEADLRAALQSGQSLAQVAASKGVAVETVIEALVAESRTRITEMVNRPGALGRGRAGRGPAMVHRAERLTAAASALGMSEAELRAAMRDGQSLAQIAASKGIPVQTVIDSLVAEARTHLAEHVAAGRITQAEADEKLAAIRARVTEMVNRAGGLRRGPGRGPGEQPATAPAGEQA